MTDKYQQNNIAQLIYDTAISVIEDCTSKIFSNILDSHIIQFQSYSNILNHTDSQQLKAAIEHLYGNYKRKQISQLHLANIDFIIGREETQRTLTDMLQLPRFARLTAPARSRRCILTCFPARQRIPRRT
ncbi:MAG: hypothetical protein F6K24_28920, partial [Okeania sp. SIO2D1]|nr:hypothetical protein [Okeania sp. SIO2D1]